MPPFKIERPDLSTPDSLRQFVGVWSSEIGFVSGIGRHGMLIVTKVETPNRVGGYYIWGSPTAQSPGRFPAGADSFAGSVAGNQLTFHGSQRYSVTATLTQANKLTVVQTRDSGQADYITLNSIWRLVDAEKSNPSAAADQRP
jgi:hypothetical protein